MKTINLFGPVGDEFDGFTDADVAEQVDGHTGPLLVRINSPGGYAYHGTAIYNLLAPLKPTVEVVGLAASAASVIAMAGDTIHMATGAEMMIHEAWGVLVGNPAKIEADLAHLRILSDSLADIYATRPGVDRNEIREAMRSDLWLPAGEAVKRGLADTAGGGGQAVPDDFGAVLAVMEVACPVTPEPDEARVKELRERSERIAERKARARLAEIELRSKGLTRSQPMG